MTDNPERRAEYAQAARMRPGGTGPAAEVAHGRAEIEALVTGS